MTNLRSLIQKTADRFREAGIASFQSDAELLIAFDLGISRGELAAQSFLGTDVTPSPDLESMIERRASREPLQHITKEAYFRSLVLEVGPGVFVPRPETEAVVQIGLDFLSGKPGAKVLDIGTGSGAISIAIALESDSRVTAVEKSPDAAGFAASNIERCDAQVNLKTGDFRELDLEFGLYDLVISNPPYIPQSAIPLDPEVRDFDPPLALYGGEDGLDLIREIIDFAWISLRDGGMLVLEHADGQSDQVCELLLANWQEVKAHPDPTGRLRAVSATR